MEFRIAKTEFLRGLRLAQGIADRKSTMPMLDQNTMTREQCFELVGGAVNVIDCRHVCFHAPAFPAQPPASNRARPAA